MTEYSIRPALIEDCPVLEALIADSARELSREYYTDMQIEAAITHIFGVDSELITDGTYFVVESNKIIVACGGWSKRRTLFGGDRFSKRKPGFLDPKT
jgi:hypothetical protein